MAVEIKEMIIRVELDPPQNDRKTPSQNTPGMDPNALIEECAREVLRILRKKQER